MKFYILILLFFINTYSQESDIKLFEEANNLYDAGFYKKSIQTYNLIKYKNGEVWFNIGNSYYKLNLYAHAVCSWKKALNFAHYGLFCLIEQNINYVNNQFNIKQKNNFFGHFKYFIVKCLSLLSLFWMQIIFLICWSIFVLSLYYMIKRKLFYLLLIICFLNFACFCLLAVKYMQYNKIVSIVLENGTPVYAGPGKEYHQVNIVNKFDQVNPDAKIGKWIKISANNIIGWVNLDYILIL